MLTRSDKRHLMLMLARVNTHLPTVQARTCLAIALERPTEPYGQTVGRMLRSTSKLAKIFNAFNNSGQGDNINAGVTEAMKYCGKDDE